MVRHPTRQSSKAPEKNNSVVGLAEKLHKDRQELLLKIASMTRWSRPMDMAHHRAKLAAAREQGSDFAPDPEPVTNPATGVAYDWCSEKRRVVKRSGKKDPRKTSEDVRKLWVHALDEVLPMPAA